MNIRNTIAASTLLLTTAFASSAFALVPTSPLYNHTPSNSAQLQTDNEVHEGVVLLFGVDNTPSSTIHDTLAQPGVDRSTYLVSAE